MISKSITDFLKALKKNNNRDWFNANKDKYEAAKKDFIIFTDELIAGLSKIDSRIGKLEGKRNVMRIFRDVRFSKDKTPYKTSMSAMLKPGGRKSEIPGYYIHLEPGNKSILIAGTHQPEPPKLKAIRQEIDYNVKDLNKILNNKDFKKYFDGLHDYDKLKTAPKGYPKDHPQIELLKHKSFLALHRIPDKQFTDKNLRTHLLKVAKAMKPLNVFLEKAMS